MTMKRLAWPYTYAGVSGPLSSADESVLVANDTVLTPASTRQSGNTLTIGGRSIQLNDLTQNIRFARIERTPLIADLTGGASKARRGRRARVDGTIESEWFFDYGENAACKTLKEDDSGIRCIYVEKEDAEFIAGVVYIASVSETQPEDSGQTYFTVTFGNASDANAPFSGVL